jgi:hypothetical protein
MTNSAPPGPTVWKPLYWRHEFRTHISFGTLNYTIPTVRAFNVWIFISGTTLSKSWTQAQTTWSHVTCPAIFLYYLLWQAKRRTRGAATGHVLRATRYLSYSRARVRWYYVAVVHLTQVTPGMTRRRLRMPGQWQTAVPAKWFVLLEESFKLRPLHWFWMQCTTSNGTSQEKILEQWLRVFGPKGCGFEIGRDDGFLRAIKSTAHLPFEWEVKPEGPMS